MQKSCRYFLVCVIAAGLFACVREPHEASSGSSPQRASRLSVDEARAFFEKNLPSDVTRASDAVPTGPFVVENVLPDWEGAEQSSNKRIACVDVPAQTGSEFLIKRRRADGTFYGVRAYGKLLVVKSMQTDSLSTYMRYLVPDEIYATFYDGDLSNLFANCEDRGDYCGLELYTTLARIRLYLRYPDVRIRTLLAAAESVGGRLYQPTDRRPDPYDGRLGFWR